MSGFPMKMAAPAAPKLSRWSEAEAWSEWEKGNAAWDAGLSFLNGHRGKEWMGDSPSWPFRFALAFLEARKASMSASSLRWHGWPELAADLEFSAKWLMNKAEKEARHAGGLPLSLCGGSSPLG